MGVVRAVVVGDLHGANFRLGRLEVFGVGNLGVVGGHKRLEIELAVVAEDCGSCGHIDSLLVKVGGYFHATRCAGLTCPSSIGSWSSLISVTRMHANLIPDAVPTYPSRTVSAAAAATFAVSRSSADA